MREKSARRRTFAAVMAFVGAIFSIGCGLVDLDGLTSSDPAADAAEASQDGPSGSEAAAPDARDGAVDAAPAPRFCAGHSAAAFCDDFDDGLSVESAFAIKTGTSYGIIADPDDPTNHVLQARYQSPTPNGDGTELVHGMNGAVTAARSELSMRFRVLSATSTYVATAVLRYTSSSAVQSSGIAIYGLGGFASAENGMQMNPSPISLAGSAWHTAKLSLARDDGSNKFVGSVTIDGEVVATSRQPIVDFDSMSASVGAFYTSDDGACAVLLDDVLLEVFP